VARGEPETAVDASADRFALDVRGLHEVFRVWYERRPGLKERLYRFKRANYRNFHALDGIDLQIRHGESVALIGHNGSGKSTLLKVLAGILPPDAGEVRVNGRVATLLELGAGFHEELTGRENIYLNGAILGLRREEIDAAFDHIVEFAGVRPFLDQPVRNYSSGMYVRLGFAIAVHVDPDVLLVDEVLSVGDATFQDRSFAQMRNFGDRGKTVVLVSHDLGSVRALCERTVVLHCGRIAFDGPTDDAIEAYEALLAEGEGGELPDPHAPLPEEPGRSGDFAARLTQLTARAGEQTRRLAGGSAHLGPVASGTTVTLEVEVAAREDLVPHGGLSVGVNMRRPDVQPSIYETRTAWRATYVAPPPQGSSLTATVEFDANLLTGSYLIDLQVGSAETGALHDRWAGAAELAVEAVGHDFGIAPLDARFRVHNPDGVWPAESLPPPLEEGGPRFHPLRDGETAPGAGDADDRAERR
jgi:ABC-2 type transport system ATP-binding protein